MTSSSSTYSSHWTTHILVPMGPIEEVGNFGDLLPPRRPRWARLLPPKEEDGELVPAQRLREGAEDGEGDREKEMEADGVDILGCGLLCVRARPFIPMYCRLYLQPIRALVA